MSAASAEQQLAEMRALNAELEDTVALLWLRVECLTETMQRMVREADREHLMASVGAGVPVPTDAIKERIGAAKRRAAMHMIRGGAR